VVGPTETDQIRPPEVSDRQSIAIDALIGGATHREAAEIAGVERTTVTGWCNHNITFIAEQNQRRKQRLTTAGERLHEATGAALEAVLESINNGDMTTALRFIRIVGVKHLLHAAQPRGSTPLAAAADLAADLRSDLLGEMFVSEEISRILEDDSTLHGD